MTSMARLVRFGVGRRRSVHEYFVRALTTEETRELCQGGRPIVVLPGDTGVTGLLGQMG